MQARGWPLIMTGAVCLCWGIVALVSSLRGARAIKPGLSLCGSGLLLCLLGWSIEADARRRANQQQPCAEAARPQDHLQRQHDLSQA